MTSATFDTLKVARRLRDAGLPEAQADALTEAMRESVSAADLVTKADLKVELSELRADILKWMFGVVGVQTLVILGAVIALVRTIRP